MKLKKGTLRQALAWPPLNETLNPVGVTRADSANDEPFLPPPPPTLQARVVNFGGRQARYKEQRQQLLRVYDPYTQSYVAFCHERYLLAWLLMRFCPLVTELDHSPEPIAYMCAGRQVLARPHLTWRIVGSKRNVCFWLCQEWSDEERLRLEKFSATHDVGVVLGNWLELEAQTQLLDNLQTGRQRMTAVQQAGLDIRRMAQEVLRHLRAHDNQATRGELGAELCARHCVDCDVQVDAALFHLHGVGRLKLELEDIEFGDDTRVRMA